LKPGDRTAGNIPVVDWPSWNDLFTWDDEPINKTGSAAGKKNDQLEEWSQSHRGKPFESRDQRANHGLD